MFTVSWKILSDKKESYPVNDNSIQLAAKKG
jgi:hypothetical protein